MSTPPALIGQHDYYNTTTSTRYHLLYTNDGQLHKNVAGTVTALSDEFTAGDFYPDFETANNFAIITNGLEQRKFDGTNVRLFSIVRPTVGTLAGAAGSAGAHNGTYELRITYYNSATGHESSASNTASATVVCTNDEIDWTNIPVPGDPQVTHVYLYVRNTATMAQFFRAGSVAAGTTTGTTDVADDALLIPAPDTAENDPPPSDVKYVAFHQGRLFMASDTVLYWSKPGDVESFDPDAFDLVNSGDGQKITGLHSDHETLYIFKEDRLYGLFGNDPNVWEIRLLDADTGCSSHRTLVSAVGLVWWWSRAGAVRYDGSTMDFLGLRTYGTPDDTINGAALIRSSVGYDENEGRVVFAVPAAGQTSRANVLLPWTLKGLLESDGWDPMDAASLGSITDTLGNTAIFLGNYKGQIFRVWVGGNDGLPDDIGEFHTGTFVAENTSITILTDLDAEWPTITWESSDISALLERKVTVLNDTGKPMHVSIRRPHIIAGTATELTLSVAIAGLIVGHTYTYIIAGPDFQWDSAWLTGSEPWVKKRYTYLNLFNKGVGFGATSRLLLAFDDDDTFKQPEVFELPGNGNVWGDDWGILIWGAPAAIRTRLRIARTGFSWKFRMENNAVNEDVALMSLAASGEYQTGKR